MFSVLVWLAFSLIYHSRCVNVFQFLIKIWIWVWSGVLCDVFWLGLIRFIVVQQSCGTVWCINIDVEAQKQPSSTPPHSDTETLKHLQDFGFVGWALSLSITPLDDYWVARELIGAWWGEEGGARLGRYQLIGPSVSPSLSDSSCISSVFPESLLADELMEGEFLKGWETKGKRRWFIKILTKKIVQFVSAWLTSNKINRGKSELLYLVTLYDRFDFFWCLMVNTVYNII